MKKILLRAGKSPFTQMPPEVALEGFPSGVWGTNVGNLVFSDSIHRLLSTPSTRIEVDGLTLQTRLATPRLIHHINHTYDHLVIPLANAFRPTFQENLSRLTNIISKVDIPVTVVGVGIAGGRGSLADTHQKASPELAREVDRFMRAVLERGPSIGVRGEFTAQFLESLGFGAEHVQVIGCPSVFKFGPDLQINQKVYELSSESLISLNVTHYVPELGEISVHNLRNYRQLDYISQVTADAQMLMWGQDLQGKRSKKMPSSTRHPLYLKDRMRFFTDSESWTRHLAAREFVFGSRIHGNIAAIISGTPAFVLAHDTRTLELARYHSIPHLAIPDLDGRLDASEFFELADYATFNVQHRENFERFSHFLTAHGLSHVYEPGHSNPEYDQKIRGLDSIPPLRPLTTTDPAAQQAAYARIQLARDPEFHRTMVRAGKQAMDNERSGNNSSVANLGGSADNGEHSKSDHKRKARSGKVSRLEQAARRRIGQIGVKLQRLADY